MLKAMLDTDIISYHFKGNDLVYKNISAYLNHFDIIQINIISYYEITAGLLSKNSFKKLDVFEEFAAENIVLPLTESSSKISADLYSKMRKAGTPVDDIDLLIAGIAIENELVLVTNNEKHFARIPGLEIQNWSKKLY